MARFGWWISTTRLGQAVFTLSFVCIGSLLVYALLNSEIHKEYSGVERRLNESDPCVALSLAVQHKEDRRQIRRLTGECTAFLDDLSPIVPRRLSCAIVERAGYICLRSEWLTVQPKPRKKAPRQDRQPAPASDDTSSAPVPPEVSPAPDNPSPGPTRPEPRPTPLPSPQPPPEPSGGGSNPSPSPVPRNPSPVTPPATPSVPPVEVPKVPQLLPLPKSPEVKVEVCLEAVLGKCVRLGQAE